MKIVFLGLSLSSSWGNGHATTYRGLIRALSNRGHNVTFFERDVPWYHSNRDLDNPAYCSLYFYNTIEELQENWSEEILDADAVILGSYVPEGIALGKWITCSTTGVSVFYDIDTPVTLEALKKDRCDYLSRDLISMFDLYLSFSGGPVLDTLMGLFGAHRAEALYCAVDPELYQPIGPAAPVNWDLGYLGTYSPDRQPSLDELLIRPATEMPLRNFTVAGSLYPPEIRWPNNIRHFEHLNPEKHPIYYAQQRYTLNVTRAPMVKLGYSPSVRLFEAASCGTPIISDYWEGLPEIFIPGEEILIARSRRDVSQILEHGSEAARRSIGSRARARILKEHTPDHRAERLENLIRSETFISVEMVSNMQTGGGYHG